MAGGDLKPFAINSVPANEQRAERGLLDEISKSYLATVKRLVP